MGLAVLPESTAEARFRVVGGKQAYTSESPSTWQRPTDWLSLGSISASDNKFVGLYAVTDDDTNFLALSAAGDYTVDWGDGTTENVASGVQANHQYTYSSISAGTASSRGYRQVIVTVTPQSGQTFSSINIRLKHSQAGLNAYEVKWLDVAIAGSSLTTITIGSNSEAVVTRWLEQAVILSSAKTTWANQFYNCRKLQSVSVASSASVTSTSGMFYQAFSLQTVPLFDTSSVTNMQNMFNSCNSLQTVPLFDTSSVTNMSDMFSGCYSLQTVPLFDTSSVTSMSGMFTSCISLQTVPLFDTSSVTSMSSMFYLAYSLQTVPLFDTSSVAFMSDMFRGCQSLQTVPLFSTASVTNMSTMFYQASLQTVPLFDTSSVTNMSSMFSGCTSLQTVPLFSTSSVTDMSSMFNSCNSLQTVPLFSTSSVTNMSSMFTSCTSLAVGALSGTGRAISYATCSLSNGALEAIMDNLGVAYGAQTLTISSNWGAPAQVSLSGTTTSGSTTVTMASTTGLSTGMEISGTGISSSVSATVQDSGDTLTRTAHGLSDGDRIGVLTLNGAGGGIALNTPYYVVNKTANTFQVADTAGGSAKTITATPKFTAVTSGFSDTDANNYTTASVTLTTGRLYLLSVENSHGTSATAISSVTGGAGVPTFTSRVTSNLGTSATLNRVSIWSAVPSSDYTGTLTINFGGTTQTGACWSLVEVVNVDTATNNGIVASNSAKGSGTTPSVTAAALTTSTNALFGAIGSLATSGAPIGRYTEVHDVAATTPAQSLQTLYQSAISETIDRTISETTTSANWGTCYVEVKAGTATADGAATINYGTTISSIVTNTSVTLSVPASASGTITTSSALLKRSKARIHGFTVSG